MSYKEQNKNYQKYEKELTEKQWQEVRREMISNGVPVRFSYKLQNLNINTGELLPIKTKPAEQKVYWNFSKETAEKIAGWLDIKCEFI